MELAKLRLCFVSAVLTTMVIVLICGYTDHLHVFAIKAFNATKRRLDRTVLVDKTVMFTKNAPLQNGFTETLRGVEITGLNGNERTVDITALFTQSIPLQNRIADCVVNITKLRNHVSPEERQKLIADNSTFLRHVQPGGRYRPVHCKASGNVAVIVPYRNREKQLPIFVRHMHSFLQTQQIGYAIFIIEMVPGIPFNRGLLMNIGFEMATGLDNFTCFVFHDVDLLPTNERNLYQCSQKIRHMSTGNSKNKYKVPYPTYIGGVISFNEKQYRAVNGFSNQYFGWGQEDDDMQIRLKNIKYTFDRIEPGIGRYEAMNHSMQEFDDRPMVNRKELIQTSRLRQSSEGLNSLIYKRLKFETRDTYTWALIDVNKTDLHNRYLLCNKKSWPCDFKKIIPEPT